MSDAAEDRRKAEKYGEGDVLKILYGHHAIIHETVEQVEQTTGPARGSTFDKLKALLTAHETAEQAVVRPASARASGAAVGEERTSEEREADQVLAQLSTLDVDSEDFETQFADFKQAVTEHAEAEEDLEFPALETDFDEEQRRDLGRRFEEAFNGAGGML